MSWQALVALCSLGILICYADRSNISTAMITMSEQYHWEKSFQGVILSSFFAGYMLTQLLGGRLADRYGGKLVLAGGVTVWSACTVATPWAAQLGVPYLLACRVAMGLGEGVAFPAIHSLISQGVPKSSQSTSVAVVTAASYVGTALAFGIVPTVIQSYGWEESFYLFGYAALLWLPCWLPFRVPKMSPADLPEPTEAGSDAHEAGEARALLEEVADPGDSTPILGPAPASGSWENLLLLCRRREVIAICVAQYTQSWGLYGLISWLPTFFSEYYHVELGQLGGLTMLPYVVQGGMGAVSGFAADTLIARGFRVRTVRVGLQVVGMLGPAACLVAATSPLSGGSQEAGSLLVTAGLSLSALTLGGVSVSHLDIAPRNAGAVFGAGNTFATLAGLLATPANGLLLDATGDSWGVVFGVIAAHYIVGALLWTLWAGDQPLKEDL